MKTRITMLGVALGLLATASAASAQHYYGYRHHHCYPQYRCVPYHHGCYYGHSHWCHVVPHHHHYHGCYYRVGRCHYYTASAIVGLDATTDANGVTKLIGVIEPEAPVELTFGGFARTTDLAARLAVEANALCLDLHYNFKGNAKFADVYADAHAVLQAAKLLEDGKADRKTQTARLADAQKRFERVLGELSDWKRTQTKLIGTNELAEKLVGVEAVMYHLCHDVGVKLPARSSELITLPGDKTDAARPTGLLADAATVPAADKGSLKSLTKLYDGLNETAPLPATTKGKK
jgi:hypothetical protein